jgi:hypothetical protein
VVSNVADWLRRRGISIARLRQLHPTIDRAYLAAQRTLYIHQFFRAGPRRRGTAQGRTFVFFNHNYDLDIDAFCAAETPHTLWVIEPFRLFTDTGYYFPPEQRDLNCVYGAGAMRESIARIKADFVSDFARRLKRETHLDALITPADTYYYLRPLIEELHALGVPTIVQDKEGTIAPSALMTEYAQLMAERYPPIADAYFFWNQNVCDYWKQIGMHDGVVLGQPRSDFFFHERRWPAKSTMGLTEGKRLVVAFTYDSDAYLRTNIPDVNRPWKPLRDDLHEALRALARERDDVEIVVKAHPQQAELQEVVDEFAAHGLPNVKVMAGAGTASHLIVRADVIVGFQSTVMIEAMLTKKPVIYAGWGAEHDRRSAELVPIHTSGGCELPKSRTDLDRMLRASLAGELQPSAEMLRSRRAFTDRYFYGADGHVCERVLDAAARVTVR